MVNIKDIANKVGLSVSTVSKALNDYSDINSETKKKVREAAKQLDYLPNVMARSLITKTSNTIGVFFGDQINSGFDHPFFSQLICSIKNTIGLAGYDLLIFSNQKRDTSSFKSICYERGVDGVILILTGHRRTDDKILELHNSLPVVYIDSVPNSDYKNVCFVESDNEKAAYDATEHLIKLGHRKILKVAGDNIAKASFDRISGYKRALQEHNIPVNKQLIQYGNFSKDQSYKVVQSSIKNKIDFDAVFASSDLMAFGAIEALKNLNIKVPDDIAVVGFDDIDMAKLYQPALTTMHQQSYRMGEIASQILLENIKNKDDVVRNAKLPAKLVARDSSG
ncbi:LacI family transcriptional regulator [Sporolactobacillus shoreae]|uniref:LacI family transcriptional regulator n=1 Tax=Sporolactobacillus shoreae TaxID=1465501 RepID=A0A4Z0GSC6_9BACL|nr:LacI family DNA-binding transcriptional regulator [Sporolactobacillus shoreae]TGA99827.1 LacI family transcriptional regulator [Sporolactobacillus shoreae]